MTAALQMAASTIPARSRKRDDAGVETVPRRFTQRGERDVGKRVYRHSFDRALKRKARVGKTILTQPESADRVPRVGAALAPVQMAGRFEPQLGVEILERLRRRRRAPDGSDHAASEGRRR